MIVTCCSTTVEYKWDKLNQTVSSKVLIENEWGQDSS